MTLRTRFADLKYDWAHAPKKQRGGLIACAVAVVGIACLWQVLAGVQDATLGAKDGNPFGGTVQAQQAQGNAAPMQKREPGDGGSENAAEAESEKPQQGTDVSIAEVEAHANGCAPIDKLPAVAIEAAPGAERQLQALLDTRFDGGRGASAYLDTSKGVIVSQGEAEQVAFTLAVVGADGRDIVSVEMTYAPVTHQFGIATATAAAEPPETNDENA